ncbi:MULTISPECIES: DoxX family membrane protein [Arthrobacter]|uniref:DoxX family membrane protein n=2 Tax=Arthrobacter TaxID=1663 RepID=A0ABU9KRV2_9MICC|nr:DoxX family membrane protein [Arthrobacter sp. YJM1]MDP5228613.1 DoxX family membrane protein [Arthrobacter sp. YJM1]
MYTHPATRKAPPALTAGSHQAFLMLRTIFTVAPILFGLDKFFNLLTYWPQYLAPTATHVVPVAPQQFMYAVGVIEIIAGLLVAWKPRVGSLVASLWLLGIIVNLLILPGFFDVALRDFGLLVAALALNRLSVSGTRTAPAAQNVSS